MAIDLPPTDGATRLPVSFELYPAANGCRSHRPRPHHRQAHRGRPGVHLGDLRCRRLDPRPLAHSAQLHPREHDVCSRWPTSPASVPQHVEANRLVRQFLDAGITSFLALRGDPPLDGTPLSVGDLQSAAELVQLIHRVQQEREPFAQEAVRGTPGGTRLRAPPPPRAGRRRGLPQRSCDLARSAAGDRRTAGQAGVGREPRHHAAVLPGGRLPRLRRARPGGRREHRHPSRDHAGVERSAPAAHRRAHRGGRARRAAHRPRDRADARRGAARSRRPSSRSSRRRCIAEGAPGLHLYTHNKHTPVLDVLERLDRLPRAARGPIKENA